LIVGCGTGTDWLPWFFFFCFFCFFISATPLPQSHTCFNQLDLPMYTSEKEMREKLLKAIHEGNAGGFTLA